MSGTVLLSVIRIASPGDYSSAAFLKDAIVSYFQKNHLDHNSSATDHAGADQSTFSVVNKYFSATVALKEIGDRTGGGQTSKDDGIILVFDAAVSQQRSNTDLSSSSTSSSFDSLEPLHDTLEESKCGDLLRLCVGSITEESSPETENIKEREKEYSRRVLWCLDRGYEYIEADFLSQEGLEKGHDARDKDGFARIIEAVAGTVWSSAVMGAGKQKVDDPTRSKHPPLSTMVDSIAGSLPVVSSCNDKERQEMAKKALLAESKHVDISSSYLDDNEGIDHEERQKRLQDREQERAMEEFESALQDVNKIRDVSKSGDLTDEERRKRAGDAAVLLFDLMGKMGFDDDDSSTEGP